MEGLSSAPAPTAQDQEQRGTVTPWATPGVTPRGKRRPGPMAWLAGHAHAWRGGQPATHCASAKGHLMGFKKRDSTEGCCWPV